ncbi:MAG: RDD family protein [Gemmatimonadetes bacterium]|nr:RDD family protein [Gemmatimonadota bacterium]
MTAEAAHGAPGDGSSTSPFASLAERCVSGVVDLVAIALLEWPVSRASRDGGFASQLLVQLLPALYLILAYTRFGGGRTLGKWMLGLRVVDAAGAPLSFVASAKRWAVLLGIAWPLWWLRPSGPDLTMPPPLVGWGVLSMVLGVVLVDSWLLIANVPARRSLHDLAAGSYVVRRGAHPPFPAGAPTAAQWRLSALLVALGALASAPLWRSTSSVAPRAVELARVTGVLGRARQVPQLVAWPTYRASGADTAWRVTLYAAFARSRPPQPAADDTVHALACAVAKYAPRAAAHAEIVAVTRFAGDAMPSGLRFNAEDLTPSACAAP